MWQDGRLEDALRTRYSRWDGVAAQAMLAGDLETAAAPVEAGRVAHLPRSGRQERLEMLVIRYIG